MKTEIAVAAGMLVLALSAPAAASPREYNRGYYDCSNGQFDEDAQSRAYREGCRDAQREQGAEPDRAEQDVGERGEPQPELVGAHGGG